MDVTGDTGDGESNDTVASEADEGANEPVSETGGTSRAASEDGGSVGGAGAGGVAEAAGCAAEEVRELPYGGDVMAAQRAGDRAAIREIMSTRVEQSEEQLSEQCQYCTVFVDEGGSGEGLEEIVEVPAECGHRAHLRCVLMAVRRMERPCCPAAAPCGDCVVSGTCPRCREEGFGCTCQTRRYTGYDPAGAWSEGAQGDVARRCCVCRDNFRPERVFRLLHERHSRLTGEQITQMQEEIRREAVDREVERRREAEYGTVLRDGVVVAQGGEATEVRRRREAEFDHELEWAHVDACRRCEPDRWGCQRCLGFQQSHFEFCQVLGCRRCEEMMPRYIAWREDGRRAQEEEEEAWGGVEMERELEGAEGQAEWEERQWQDVLACTACQWGRSVCARCRMVERAHSRSCSEGLAGGCDRCGHIEARSRELLRSMELLGLGQEYQRSVAGGMQRMSPFFVPLLTQLFHPQCRRAEHRRMPMGEGVAAILQWVGIRSEEQWGRVLRAMEDAVVQVYNSDEVERRGHLRTVRRAVMRAPGAAMGEMEGRVDWNAYPYVDAEVQEMFQAGLGGLFSMALVSGGGSEPVLPRPRPDFLDNISRLPAGREEGGGVG